MFNQPCKVQFPYGDHTVTISTGGIARQANGAVVVEMNDTVVLVTVVASHEPRTGVDFLPLTVEYQERTYAGGRIPGGFFKREGRPTERETLCARLIDRPIRPLFPKNFRNELQVIATIMSLNPEVPADIPALLGASAALAISGIPFAGPVGAARVGYVDGQYILNPSASQIARDSQLDLVVAGTRSAVLMVESGAQGLSEATMLGAVMFGHQQMQAAINAIETLAAEAGTPAWSEAPTVSDEGVIEFLAVHEPAIAEACAITVKAERRERLATIKAAALATATAADPALPWTEKQISDGLRKIQSSLIRQRILDGGIRLDGRDLQTVRPLSMMTGLLPRTHGSALFTRGETQVIAVTTLGTLRDSQLIDAPEGESREPFLLHYNFPPYCTGETGRLATKRREIGHGRLAKRALAAVMPDLAERFPYTVRIVAEVTESNGSSSMASICGGCLSLMDAGVPISAPVAGVAMGLIMDGKRYAVLTDILGDEDHIGDMDFKVAGTRDGITALQMDLKTDGITAQIMEQALAQAKVARLHILGEMAKVLDAPRKDLSPFAPRTTTFKIDPERIRDVIGKGGAIIQALTRETGASIDIDQDGTVRVTAVDRAAANAAIERINAITRDVEVGAVYDGRVARLMDFGAFVTILPGKDGLVHISQISEQRVERVADILAEGDMVRVKVLEVDKQGHIRLSMRAVEVVQESDAAA